MGLTVTTPPNQHPVTLDEAKTHLRIDHSDEDTLLDSLIAAATVWAEESIGRTFMARTWLQTRQRFGNWMELPRGPVSAVSSIQYIDSVLYLANPGGTTVQSPDGYYKVLTMSASEYYTALDGPIGAVGLNLDGEWPSIASRTDAVRITFTTGYSAVGDVPVPIRQAILVLVQYLYEHRGSAQGDIPLAAKALLQPYKIFHLTPG